MVNNTLSHNAVLLLRGLVVIGRIGFTMTERVWLGFLLAAIALNSYGGNTTMALLSAVFTACVLLLAAPRLSRVDDILRLRDAGQDAGVVERAMLAKHKLDPELFSAQMAELLQIRRTMQRPAQHQTRATPADVPGTKRPLHFKAAMVAGALRAGQLVGAMLRRLFVDAVECFVWVASVVMPAVCEAVIRHVEAQPNYQCPKCEVRQAVLDEFKRERARLNVEDLRLALRHVAHQIKKDLAEAEPKDELDGEQRPSADREA
jgi:hypothetical protein